MEHGACHLLSVSEYYPQNAADGGPRQQELVAGLRIFAFAAWVSENCLYMLYRL